MYPQSLPDAGMRERSSPERKKKVLSTVGGRSMDVVNKRKKRGVEKDVKKE